MSQEAQRIVSPTSRFNPGNFLWYWVPPFLWMGVIFILSTDMFSASGTGGILERLLRWLYPSVTITQLQWTHFLVRKGAHLTIYAILALLVMRAFRAGAAIWWQRRWAIYSFFIVSIYALLDEYHQTFTNLRSGTPWDSFIDMTGGAIALFGWWLLSRRKQL